MARLRSHVLEAKILIRDLRRASDLGGTGQAKDEEIKHLQSNHKE
jgi:hypothetical protein